MTGDLESLQRSSPASDSKKPLCPLSSHRSTLPGTFEGGYDGGRRGDVLDDKALEDGCWGIRGTKDAHESLFASQRRAVWWSDLSFFESLLETYRNGKLRTDTKKA